MTGSNYDLFATERPLYGYHCWNCGAIWDAYQVPIPMEVAMQARKATCRCGSTKVLIVQPDRYEELKRGSRIPATADPVGFDLPDGEST
jgi:DNA-directed RNA polymerase subunit RPC12/RpoP